MSSVCDRKPCRGLTSVLPLLEFRMEGEGNGDLKASILATNGSAPDLYHVTLHYCPFCGMRMDEDLIEIIQRTRNGT